MTAERFLRAIESSWAALAGELADEHDMPEEEAGRVARQMVERSTFLAMCRQRGVSGREIGASSGNSPHSDPLAEREGASTRIALGMDSNAPVLVPAALAMISEGALPADALGWIHERLLGRQLVRRADGRTQGQSHLRAKKLGGVFYTPEYVCQYLAEKAIAPFNGQMPRILDPACGCGAFLLAAYRRLRERSPAAAPETLARCLHGVDIDPEAVVVARRSLWLEILAEKHTERADSLAAQLAANIRAGDVLAGTAIEAAGPFDVVLGNPPYRRELHTKAFFDRIAATELGRRYRTARMDLWYYFLHRGLELLKPGGRLSFIVGAYWTQGRGAKRLIDTLRTSVQIEEIFVLGRLRVFPAVSGQHLILTLIKEPGRRPTVVKTADPHDTSSAEPYVRGEAPVTVFQKTAAQLFHNGGIDLEPPCDGLFAHLETFTRLAELGEVRQGIAENPASVTARTNQQHDNRWSVGEGVFVLSTAELERLDLPKAEMALLRPYHDLCDVGRYELAEPPSRWLIYSTEQTCPDIEQYPVLRRHLERFRPIMDQRRETLAGKRRWWQLHWPREASLWQAVKLICVQMAPRPAFVPAIGPVYVPFSVNVFVPGPATREHVYYLAAVLNSRLLWDWFSHLAKRRGVGLEINGHVLARAPIRRIDFSVEGEVSCHDRLVELVGRRLQCPSCAAETEEEIDRLVEELYGVWPAGRR